MRIRKRTSFALTAGMVSILLLAGVPNVVACSFTPSASGIGGSISCAIIVAKQEQKFAEDKEAELLNQTVTLVNQTIGTGKQTVNQTQQLVNQTLTTGNQTVGSGNQSVARNVSQAQQFVNETRTLGGELLNQTIDTGQRMLNESVNNATHQSLELINQTIKESRELVNQSVNQSGPLVNRTFDTGKQGVNQTFNQTETLVNETVRPEVNQTQELVNETLAPSEPVDQKVDKTVDTGEQKVQEGGELVNQKVNETRGVARDVNETVGQELANVTRQVQDEVLNETVNRTFALGEQAFAAVDAVEGIVLDAAQPALDVAGAEGAWALGLPGFATMCASSGPYGADVQTALDYMAERQNDVGVLGASVVANPLIEASEFTQNVFLGSEDLALQYDQHLDTTFSDMDPHLSPSTTPNALVAKYSGLALAAVFGLQSQALATEGCLAGVPLPPL
jgi:hypothetical protein